MRRLSVILVSLLLLALLPTSAGAITNGEVDDEPLYPFVGMLAFYDADGYSHRCSGTLISSTVVVTASHCTDGTTSARAYFDVAVDPTAYPNAVGGIPGTPITHPDYNPRTITNDVGMVVLDPGPGDPATPGPPYPVLPAEGMLSQMKRDHELKDASFVAVGYGGVTQWPPPVITFDFFRRFVSSPYGSLTKNNLHLQQNPNSTGGGGGTCFGDSGGPHFWVDTDDTLVLVSVTSWGDAICRSNDMTQRLDIPSALDFLDG